MEALVNTEARPSEAIADVEAAAKLPSPGALRSLVVHMDAGPRAETRLQIADSLAQRYEATVTAVYAATAAVGRLPVALDSAAIGPVYALLAELDRARRDDAKARYDAVCAMSSAPMTWQDANGTVPFWSFARRALLTDLLILGQNEPGAPDVGVPPDFVESVLIQSGTPALVLPYVWSRPAFGTCALVAWKESAASARALRAALPLLQFADEVHVVSWNDGENESEPEAAAAFLRRHGVASRVHRAQANGVDVGERLLSKAADVCADLLVMGCYGHSRARELVLGGATRTVLRSMPLPVLMAH